MLWAFCEVTTVIPPGCERITPRLTGRREDAEAAAPQQQQQTMMATGMAMRMIVPMIIAAMIPPAKPVKQSSLHLSSQLRNPGWIYTCGQHNLLHNHRGRKNIFLDSSTYRRIHYDSHRRRNIESPLLRFWRC